MTPPNKIWKKKPTKDGRNAKQRRADAKRAARLEGDPHLTNVAAVLKSKRDRQSQRWVDHSMRTRQILGYQNEIRWGLKTGNTHKISDEDQSAIERLDRERKAALESLNKGKAAAARPGAVVEPEVWVDDWFGQTVTGGTAGAGDSTGAVPGFEKKEGDAMEQDTQDEEGKKPEGLDEEKGEVRDDSDCMSGVEMGGSSL